jgi:hypothetical protein
VRGVWGGRRWGVVAGVVVAAAACGGGDGGGDDTQADGTLPPAVCDALDELDEVEKQLGAPEVFELDPAALEDVLIERRAILDDLAAGTEGELHELLADQVLSQPAYDATMLDGWAQDRRRLADAHDDAWANAVLAESVTRDDGEEVSLARWAGGADRARERLVVGCRAPELTGGPEQETTEDPPPGRLVFWRPDDDRDYGKGGRLVVTDEAGDDERELPTQDPWVTLGWMDAEPTGDHGMLVGTREAADDDADGEDREFGTVVVDSDGEVLDSLQRAPGQLSCPTWNPNSDKVVGVDNTSIAGDRRVHLLDLTGETPSRPLDLPFATVSCSDFVDDDRLVVSDATLELGDPRGVWTVGVDGEDPQELYTPEMCSTQVGAVDPSGTRVAVAQNCNDRLQSGVWVVDLASGEADQIAVGHGARPKWSPDGEWLVFGYSPLGEGLNTLSTWVARADGRQLREVVEPLALFPVWLPPA